MAISPHYKRQDVINSTHLPKILLTHPFDTCNMRDISHGRAPEWASSTIFCRVESGSGRPPTKQPPSWLIPECPFIYFLYTDSDIKCFLFAIDDNVDNFFLVFGL